MCADRTDRPSAAAAVAAPSVTEPSVLATATPPPGVGPAGLVDYWPTVVRAAWFVGGFLAVVLLGRVAVEPTFARVVRQRNRNNPTLRDALVLYFRTFVVVAALAVGIGFAGYGRVLAGSALVVGAATLAVGVAGQQVIGSLVSGTALVFDPECNVGDYIEWDDGEGRVESIALRVTRVETPDGELLTVPNTVLTAQAIARPFGRDRRRAVERVAVSDADAADVDAAVDRLEAAGADVEGVLADPAPSAYVAEFDGGTAALHVRYWIGDPSRRDVAAVRSAYARAARARLDGEAASLRPADG